MKVVQDLCNLLIKKKIPNIISSLNSSKVSGQNMNINLSFMVGGFNSITKKDSKLEYSNYLQLATISNLPVIKY